MLTYLPTQANAPRFNPQPVKADILGYTVSVMYVYNFQPPTNETITTITLDIRLPRLGLKLGAFACVGWQYLIDISLHVQHQISITSVSNAIFIRTNRTISIIRTG